MKVDITRINLQAVTKTKLPYIAKLTKKIHSLTPRTAKVTGIFSRQTYIHAISKSFNVMGCRVNKKEKSVMELSLPT